MSYVTEFANDIRCIKDAKNFTIDALSRVTIDNFEYLREGIDYGEIAAAQRDDADILDYLSKPDTTSLELEQFRVPGIINQSINHAYFCLKNKNNNIRKYQWLCY